MGNETNSKEKTILGLIGSPRRLGNCEVMAKEIFGRARKGYALTLIRMPSLDIRPCEACYACVMGKACPKAGDDMNFLLDSLAHADAYIMASPVYFLGAHSIFKRVLDRGFLLYNVLEKTYGKPCVLLNLYGMGDRLGAAPHSLRTLASFLGLDIRAEVNIKAALPGEVLLDKDTAKQAESLARRLLSERPTRQRGGCPFCGCDIVRMEEKRFVCTVCHGKFRISPSGRVVRLEGGEIFGTPEHMLLHRGWLTGMKEEFLKRRKDILRITLPYKDVGEWIEPHRAGETEPER